MPATSTPGASRRPPGFLSGLAAPLRGARLVYLQAPGLSRYWIPPVLVTLALLVVVFAWTPELADHLLSDVPAPQPAAPDAGYAARALAWLASVGTTLLRWALRGALFVAGVLLVVTVGGVLAAPFNDALSAAVEQHLGGAPTEGVDFLDDVGRSLRLELRKLGMYLAVMGPAALVALLLPVVGPPAFSAFGFLFTVAYLALDYVDWPAARRGWPPAARTALLRSHPGAMFGFGLGVWVLLWVPLLNLLFMPAAVAGGTMLFVRLSGNAGASGTAAAESGSD